MIKLQLFCPTGVGPTLMYFRGPVRSRIVHPADCRFLIEAFSTDRQMPVRRNNWSYVAYRTGVVFCCFLVQRVFLDMCMCIKILTKLAAKLTTR